MVSLESLKIGQTIYIADAHYYYKTCVVKKGLHLSKNKLETVIVKEYDGKKSIHRYDEQFIFETPEEADEFVRQKRKERKEYLVQEDNLLKEIENKNSMRSIDLRMYLEVIAENISEKNKNKNIL